MWVATTVGFFSAVEHRTDDTKVLVRSRVKDDSIFLATWAYGTDVDTHEPIPDFNPLDHVIVYQVSDYPYRVMLTKEDWALFMYEVASGIDYGNFKSAVLSRQGARRESVYHRVWAALRRLEDLEKPAPKSYGTRWWEPDTRTWAGTTAPPPPFEVNPTPPEAVTDDYEYDWEQPENRQKWDDFKEWLEGVK